MLADIQDAWNELHSIQCDLEYFLQDVNSTNIVMPKHALDMMIKYTVIKIKTAKSLCVKHIEEEDKKNAV